MTIPDKFSFYLISLCGGSASGKSLFLQKLIDRFEEGITFISQDDYYKPIEHQFKDENGIYNFDLPESIDHECLINDLIRLSSGEIVLREEYTFNHPEKVPAIRTFRPNPVVLVEGLFVLHHPVLSNLTNLRLFIDAEIETCYQRRKKRDTETRGIPFQTFQYQWEKHVMPAYYKHVLPAKTTCDIIINNNSSFEKAFSVIKNHIKATL